MSFKEADPIHIIETTIGHQLSRPERFDVWTNLLIDMPYGIQYVSFVHRFSASEFITARYQFSFYTCMVLLGPSFLPIKQIKASLYLLNSCV